MGLSSWKRERAIRKVLRALARQRVAVVLQPGNVWVVENAATQTDETEAALRTCHMRGWVELVADAIPSAELGPDGRLPPGWTKEGPMYRLTDGGWNAINRTHAWIMATFTIATASLFATVVGLIAG